VVHLKKFEPFYIASTRGKNDDHEDYHDELTLPPSPYTNKTQKGI